MDDQEEMILQGAQNAWPHAISVGKYRLRQIADRLARSDYLVKKNSQADNPGTR